jgi:hypothetical protein
MNWLRFAIGRWVMHWGLRVMPKGRSRQELTQILKSWSRHVMETVEKST